MLMQTLLSRSRFRRTRRAYNLATWIHWEWTRLLMTKCVSLTSAAWSSSELFSHWAMKKQDRYEDNVSISRSHATTQTLNDFFVCIDRRNRQDSIGNLRSSDPLEQSYLIRQQNDSSRAKSPISRSRVSIGESILGWNARPAESLLRICVPITLKKSLYKWDFEKQKSAVRGTTPASLYPAAASFIISGSRNRRIKKARRQEFNASELARLKQDRVPKTSLGKETA